MKVVHKIFQVKDVLITTTCLVHCIVLYPGMDMLSGMQEWVNECPYKQTGAQHYPHVCSAHPFFQLCVAFTCTIWIDSLIVRTQSKLVIAWYTWVCESDKFIWTYEKALLKMYVFPKQIIGHGTNNKQVPYFYPYFQSGLINVVSSVFTNGEGEGGVGRRGGRKLNAGCFSYANKKHTLLLI